jgi:TOMM system kinase/cyclase fusion protein
MDYDAILEQVVALLQRERRLSYRVLKLRLQLDDDTLEALKEDLIYAKHLATDEDGRVLVWTGGAAAVTPPGSGAIESSEPPDTVVSQDLQAGSPSPAPRPPEAERRQLTVLFCDLVDSTALASQLDPEEWREVVRAYHETCAKVIARYEGHIAQYLGDGLLVYFGYPQSHEDDAQRAVRAGLGMVEAVETLNTRLEQDKGLRLAVRVGIHTGLVVVGEMGGRGRQEQLALGDTPNVAARLQGLAAPDTVLISAATHRLVQGYVTAAALGPQTLKGVATPVPVYRILGASAAHSRLDVAAPTGLTPLVGRESEVAVLLERWTQSQAGQGQVVLLSGEGDIGKSRLVEVLRQRVVGEGSPSLTLRCSPYHAHSALYPVLEHLQRLLEWRRDDTPAVKLDTLERVLRVSGLAPDEAVPCVAALLSVPLPAGRYPPVVLTPQQQRQRTLDALIAWLLAEAERQPILAVWEDLHWADPSTLELLGLIIDQASAARLLLLLTARPEFRPPWPPRSHLTQLTLGRLSRPQVETMVRQLTGDKPLPAEVLAQVIAKTDGVPLFVEELVKMLLESGLVREEADRYGLTGPLPPLAIPATLQDSLMARLDRLSTARTVAQLGAVLGREFTYGLIRAVAPLDEATVRRGLSRLVDAELLYQRGRPPQARYLFKHALIQETAYQSLLKSTRQQAHQRSAQVLAAQFPEIAETQPELLAHHYTEAGLGAQALPYWQQAGGRARQRSANAEAIAHLTTGLEVLKAFPDSRDRARQELDLQTTLGPAFMAMKGYAAPEVAQVYTRARELCQQLGDTSRLFPVLWGLWMYHFVRAELQAAYDLGEQCLSLAHRLQTPAFRLEAHRALGTTLFFQGALSSARAHLEQSITFYDPQQHRDLVSLYGQDPKVTCLSYAAWALWLLGYPAQALQRSHDALGLAQELAHPFTLAMALQWASTLHRCRREGPATQERAEAVMALAREQGFVQRLAGGTMLRGSGLAMQGARMEGVAEMRQGLATYQAIGAGLGLTHYLALLAEAYAQAGQTAAGLTVVAEALGVVDKYGERFCEAALYRLKGDLLLAQEGRPKEVEAEACFRQALDVAHRQEAKALELRAAMSLARLWQRQGKPAEGRQLLAEVYGWFTEGFDTTDLQEAKALLEGLR